VQHLDSWTWGKWSQKHVKRRMRYQNAWIGQKLESTGLELPGPVVRLCLAHIWGRPGEEGNKELWGRSRVSHWTRDQRRQACFLLACSSSITALDIQDAGVELSHEATR